jgi:ABC-type multidrug transport system ATPase subunit/peptidoglycan/LPS O-acetylase OafA/YrhL
MERDMVQQDRLHALDAVRAFALLLGIAYHATMSFVPTLAANGWPLNDSSPSDTLSAAFYVLHFFRMTTFFVVAGFFARLVVHRKGLPAFIEDRRKRILMPLLVNLPIQWILLGAAVFWGMSKASKPLVPPLPTQEPILIPFSWTHLWFLYVLLLLYVTVLGVRWLANKSIDSSGGIRRTIDSAIHKLVNAPLAPLFLAIPVGVTLYFTSWWNFWIGIPTPDNSIIPNLAAFIGYGTAVTFGWFLHRQTNLLQSFERYWIGYFAVAIALTALCYWMVGMPISPIHLDTPMRAIYAGAYSVASWCWTFAVIGAAIRYLSGESKTRRYLADSSYWMYIMHLPLVFALQALVMQWPLHWSIKYLLILGITLALLLLSYHYWVRPTYIGEVLNGRKYPRSPFLSIWRAEPIDSPLPPVAANSNVIAITKGMAGKNGKSLASLHAVKKSYGATVALDGLDLEVMPGELLAVLGPNGAGKSTAIALMLGLHQPTSGTVSLFGESPHQLSARRNVGVMMQDVTLAPELKVREHIDLTTCYYPAPLTALEAMQQVGVTALAERPYRQLSGGQKRQVQFAMAICGRPELLFLDEPTVGLDVHAREALWATIRTLLKQGCAIVLTTHYLEEAEALANRVIVVNKGRVIASGSVADLRSLVSRRQISCASTLSVEHVSSWTEVAAAKLNQGRLSITTADAESVVRRLLAEDASLGELEVRRAGLSDVFTELTQEPVS